MRKIYSLVLMAAMLLIGTNVQAQNVAKIGNTEYATIEAAFNAATDGQTIQLIGAAPDITQTKCIEMYAAQKCGTAAAVGARHLTLDMNGHNLKLSSTATNNEYPWNFGIWQGSLHITGTGSVINAIPATSGYTYNDFEVIVCKLFGSNNINDTDFTHLTIDENVDLIATTGKSGITIDQVGNTPKNESTSPLGYTAPSVAFGVVVDVYGYVKGGKYGIQISGNINPTSKNATATGLNKSGKDQTWDNLPHVNIYSTAEVVANPTAEEATGVYAAGYGFWLIEGYVHGATGVYVKSGDLDIDDATIASDKTEGEYGGVEGKKSGVKAGGSAIVIESNQSYCGGQDVNITGDTKVTGGNGYAIDETITTADNTKVTSITIEGGSFEGGGAGNMTFTEETITDTTVTIVGGSVDGDVVIKDENGNVIEDKNITDLIPTDNNHHITTVTDPSTGKVTTVVSEGAAPTGSTTLTNGTSVKWTGTTADITSDLNLTELEMNETGSQTITVKNGHKLNIGHLIMDKDARIIVEEGATLIISGEQGAYAPDTNNIVLQTSETSPSQFLFHPNVTSNKHPNATVKLISKAYKKTDGSYVYQRFGVPAFDGMMRKDIHYTNASAFYYYDYTNDDWHVVKNADNRRLMPFECLEVTSAQSNPGEEYTMAGQLVGNVNADLHFMVGSNGWSYFANSYTADLDIKTMLNDVLDKSGEKLMASIYVYQAENNWWDLISLADIAEGEAAQAKIAPMQAFIMKTKGSFSYQHAINYKNTIWDPVMTPSAAPARQNVASDLTKVVINISALESNITDAITLRQSDRFTEEFDNGYESEKFMNQESFNIYNSAEYGDLSQLADNDIVGKIITIASAEETNFKMTFSKLRGEKLAIRDLLTNSIINITEGAEYYFSTNANTISERFEIVNRQEMPTEIETIEETVVNSGIYNMAGQYMGEDWNAVPAGIYIVNGVKAIK